MRCDGGLVADDIVSVKAVSACCALLLVAYSEKHYSVAGEDDSVLQPFASTLCACPLYAGCLGAVTRLSLRL